MKQIEKLNLDNLPEQTTNFDNMMLDAFVDVTKELKPQPVAISIGESQYKQTLYPIPFGSYGDYSCIVGSSKS